MSSIVDCKGYMADKDAFFKRHKYDFHCDTSPMDQYGVYYKTYAFADHTCWYERMAPTFRTAEAEVEVVKGVKVKIKKDVKLLEVEYYSSDTAISKKYYERW